MGSEVVKETIDEDSKILAEAIARHLATASPVSRSSSARASLEHDVDGDSPRNDSILKSNSEGDPSHGEESVEESTSTPSSPFSASSRSSSARSSFEHGIAMINPRSDSITKSKSEGDLSRGEVSTSAPSSPSSRSSSARSPFEHDVDRSNPRSDSMTKSKSEGDLSRGRGSLSTPASPDQTPQWSMTSASPPTGLVGHLSQTTSPPLQTMTHPSSYDPNRIPSSVFSTKPANTSEWSMASNDSLFSLHTGNNSFSKDQFRSDQELKRIDEGSSSDDSLNITEAKPNEVCSLPPLMEVPAHEEDGAKSSQVSSLEQEVANDSPKVGKGESPRRLSNESAHSSTSFAFPVLGNDGEKGGPLEGVEEKHDSKGVENETTGGLFACLSCLPRCC